MGSEADPLPSEGMEEATISLRGGSQASWVSSKS